MEPVLRPLKRSEYTIVFDSNRASKRWRDLNATELGHLVDAWDFLTKTPEVELPINGRLRGRLSQVERNGALYDQWQYKVSKTSGSRIWFYVDGQTVVIVEVFTAHPNQTK